MYFKMSEVFLLWLAVAPILNKTESKIECASNDYVLVFLIKIRPVVHEQ